MVAASDEGEREETHRSVVSASRRGYRREEIVGSRNVLSKIMQLKAVQSEQHWINLGAFDIHQGLHIV